MDVDVQRISFFVEKQSKWKDFLWKIISTCFQAIEHFLQRFWNYFNHAHAEKRPGSSYTQEAAAPRPAERERKHYRIEMLLSKVSFHCSPGSVTVLFGSGYESQRRLIEILALRQTSGYLSGKILYDKVSRKNGWFKDIVHIVFNANSQLSERYYSRLTVFEYLFYGARLRISHGSAECRERTRNAIKLIGLDGTATVKSLSASEVRMLSIAVELVSNPTLLCLENPIVGLDASGSIEVISLLRKIAKRPSMPTTIIYMVKYLDDDMMRYIDNVALFTEHRLVRFQEIRKSGLDVESLLQIKGLIVEASIQLKTYADSTVAVARRGIIGKFTSASQSQVNGVLRRIAKDMEQISTTVKSKSNSDSLDAGSIPSRLQSLDSSTPFSQVLLDSLYTNQDTQEFYATAHRRIGLAGQTVRGHKPIYIEVYILLSRGYKHYLNNVSFCLFDLIYSCLLLTIQIL
jgi:ABC-type multidrug transport system ATPase subunit